MDEGGTDRAEALRMLGDHLSRAETVDAVVAEVRRHALQHLHADVVGVAVEHPGKGRCRLGRALPLLAAVDAQHADLPPAAVPPPLAAGEVLVVDDTRDLPSWPAWGAALAAHRLLSACRVGLPRRSSDDAVVRLDLASRRAAAFDAATVEEAVLTAAVLGAALGHVARAENLALALESRTAIGIAQGVLMERYALSAASAMDYLRRASMQSNRSVRELAGDVLASRFTPEGR